MLPLNCVVSFTLCVIFSFPQWTNSKRRMKKLHKCPFSHRRKLSRRRPIKKIAHKIEMLHKSNHYKLDFWSSSLICKTVLLWFGLMNIYFAFSTRFITIATSRAMHSYFRKKNANTNSNFFFSSVQNKEEECVECVTATSIRIYCTREFVVIVERLWLWNLNCSRSKASCSIWTLCMNKMNRELSFIFCTVPLFEFRYCVWRICVYVTLSINSV